jgi:hypothetical protein
MGRGSNRASASANQLLLGRRLPARNRPNQQRPSPIGVRILRDIHRGQWPQALQAAQHSWPLIDDAQQQLIATELSQLTLDELPNDLIDSQRLTLALQQEWRRSLPTTKLPAMWQNRQQRHNYLRPVLKEAMAQIYAELLSDANADHQLLIRLSQSVGDTYSMTEPKLIMRSLQLSDDPVALPVLVESLTKHLAGFRGKISRRNYRQRTHQLARLLGIGQHKTDEILVEYLTTQIESVVHLRAGQQTICGQPYNADALLAPAERGFWQAVSVGRERQHQLCSVCSQAAATNAAAQERWDWSVLGDEGYAQTFAEVQTFAEKSLLRLSRQPVEYERWRNWQSSINRKLDQAAAQQLAEQLLARYGSGQQAWRRVLPPTFSVEATDEWPELDQATLTAIISAYQPSKGDAWNYLSRTAAQKLSSLLDDVSLSD